MLGEEMVLTCEVLNFDDFCSFDVLVHFSSCKLTQTDNTRPQKAKLKAKEKCLAFILKENWCVD